MKKNYLFVLAVILIALIAGYVLHIHEITDFASKIFHHIQNYWILIPALIAPFVVKSKYYWFVLAAVGIVFALLIQMLIWHSANINVNLTLMMACAFLFVNYVVNLIRVLLK